MALQTAYQQFLAAPNLSSLAQDASLHYITTLTSFHGSNDIAKHLALQARQLKKEEEKFVDVVESPTALAVTVHTTIKFITNGSTFLPALDDNFIVDRIVTFPIIHMVNFDADGRILQIRLHWDQGMLLKLMDVIGRTGRNWPIRDGKDQLKLIQTSIAAAGITLNGSKNAEKKEAVRDRNNSNVTRDPHASLNLFAPREDTMEDSLPAAVPTRSSAKPAARPYRDLFVGNDSDNSDTATPTKGVNPKAGASKGFARNRMYDHASPDGADSEEPAERYIRPNSTKYDHFDFGEADVAPTPVKEGKKSKHDSQWNFDDFTTPSKPVANKAHPVRGQDVRHWGTENDEVLETEIKHVKVDKPRKDAETHFEFVDDGGPEAGKQTTGRLNRGAGQNKGLGLYQNNLYNEDENTPKGMPKSKPDTMANTKDRSKDFDSHFTMGHDSPGAKQPTAHPLGAGRQKLLSAMDSQWDKYEEEEADAKADAKASSAKGPLTETTNMSLYKKGDGIAISGDGMGGRKGAGRQWGFGGDDDGEPAPEQSKHRNIAKPRPTGGDFWDF